MRNIICNMRFAILSFFCLVAAVQEGNQPGFGTIQPASTGIVINETLLWERHEVLGKLSLSAVGVDRQAFTELDCLAQRKVLEWVLAGGNKQKREWYRDEIGNLFVVQPGEELSRPVVFGSHLDTQPMAGRYDGVLGVLAGIAALDAIPAPTVRPLILVVWANEEGSAFPIGTMGSLVFTGQLALSQARHSIGLMAPHRSVDDCLVEWERIGCPVSRVMPQSLMDLQDQSDSVCFQPWTIPVGSYIELHIEQGPELESHAVDIGVVSGVQGQRRYRILFQGRSGHAGTVPRAQRRDAVRAFAHFSYGLDTIPDHADQALRLTIGHVDVRPGTPNTIANQVECTIDLRHPLDFILDKIEAHIYALALSSSAQVSCTAKVEVVSRIAPVEFSSVVQSLIERVSSDHLLTHRRLVSGAGHDAMHLPRMTPLSGMIFVPSAGGLSHHPDEYTSPTQLAAGTRVLASTIAALANT